MAALDLGSLDGLDPVTRTALQRLVRYINQLEGELAQFRRSSPQALSGAQLTQIQKALSSSGSNPLNLTGLTGVPKTTP